MGESNANRIKVAFVSNSAQGEYSGRLRWLPELRARGIDVTFVLPRDESAALARFAAAGVDTVETSLARGIASPRREARTFRELISCLDAGGFDIVHAFGHRANLAVDFVAQFRRHPIVFNHITGLGSVFTDEGFSLRNGILRSAVRGAYRLLAGRTAAYFFQNAEDRDEFCFADPDRCIMTAGTGVDLTDYAPDRVEPEAVARIRSELDASPDDVVIAFVGRLLRHKGIEELLAAAEGLLASGAPVILLIIGHVDHGNVSAISEAILERYVDHGRIRLLGRREDVKQLLAASDVFVNPSYREGLPRTNIEAAAMALPIVTTDVPGCRLTVDHRINGLIVPPRDVPALRDALASLVGDAQLRRTLGQRSRRLAMERFSVRDIAAQIADVYQAAVAER
jgi:glycosyltransferase involved in cell wall biosynthesis